MNLIIVSKHLRTPKKIALGERRVMLALAGTVLAVAGLGAGLGAWLNDSEHQAIAEVRTLRAELEAQQAELERARASSDRELDALVARLGELHAQANRLNALGQRLTEIGQLGDGEFDFNELPGLGGPESAEQSAFFGVGDIHGSLDAMSQRLARQSQQLSILETLLLDRGVDADLVPTGRPVKSGYASSPFGNRIDPFTGRREFHRGVDFHGERGSDILAVADGVVAFSGRHAGYGNMVDIDHGNGYLTRYAHNQANLVKPGQRVRAGEVIAKMGATGRATGTHVHFEVWQNDRPVNPHKFLRGVRG